MRRENWITFFITVDKHFLPLQSNFFVRLKAVSYSISQNLEAIDHPVLEIKNYSDRRINAPEYYGQIPRCDTGKSEECRYVFPQLSWMEFSTDFYTND